MRTLLSGLLALSLTFSAATDARQAHLAVALPAVSGTEWMDPEFLQQLRAQATSVTLGEGEARTLDLKLKKRP